MTETAKSELETLKAQLAQTRTNLLHWQGVAKDGTRNEELITAKLCESEAQVRELRELLNKAVANLWHERIQIPVAAAMPTFVPCKDTCVKCEMEKALRSAPPSDAGRSRVHLELSEWGRPIIYIADSQNGIATNKCVFSNRADAVNWVKREAFGAINWATWKPRGKYPNCEFDAEGYDPTFLAEWEGGFVRVRRTEVTTLAMENPTLAYQAPFDKTNAGEERKDLAQGSDASGDAIEGEQSACSSPKQPQSIPKQSWDGVSSPEPFSEASEQVHAAHSYKWDESQVCPMCCKPVIEPSRSEWISVEERLPYPGEDVLIAGTDFVDIAQRADEPYEKWHLTWNYEFENSKPLGTITHWQPLPSAPPSPAREKEHIEYDSAGYPHKTREKEKAE